MMDEFLPALPNGLLEEREEWISDSPPPVQPRMPAPPASRESALAKVGTAKRGVYTLARQCVDDFEKAAPWESLYYPPDDPAALVGIVGSLITAIKVVPKKIDVLLRVLPAAETGGHDPTREDVGFLLQGIHRMVGPDLKRLETVFAPLREIGSVAHGTDDEQRLCELSADLKGKYASALMGAAASLIGEGLWDSVELEPVLFPEKAEEFRCTRELVTSLKGIVAAIRALPGQIPFPQLIERWRQGLRVDQYALADLAILRGMLGRLLKPRSRRALYSGDYHQISRREVLLSIRINELERLHLLTWSAAADAAAQDPAAPYPRLIQLTLEMAAVLDAELLKTLIGEKTLNRLRGIGGKARGGEGLEALAPLLAEDDLRIFFEMLLTAVQRRASLSLQEPAPPAAAPKRARPQPALPRAAADSGEILPSVGAAAGPLPFRPPPEIPPPPAAAAAPSPPAAKVTPRGVHARVLARLAELQAPGNANWNAFRMTQRLIAKHSRLPAAMFQSVHPFLHDIREGLVPELKLIAPYKSLTAEAVQRLDTVCQELCTDDPAPADLVEEIPRKLERIVRFLDALRSVLTAA